MGSFAQSLVVVVIASAPSQGRLCALPPIEIATANLEIHAEKRFAIYDFNITIVFVIKRTNSRSSSIGG
eukprot:c38897_g1_i1 orf=210-416(+)